jgi:hypothetical protein
LFSESERDQIRTYLGFPRLFLSANPYLESAITTLQPISEGGSAPDSSTENAVRAVLLQLTALDGYISNVLSQVVNLAVYEVPVSLSNGATLKQDYRTVLATWKREGTNQIQKIANRLGIQPIRPYYYSDGLQPDPVSAYNPSFFGRRR